MELAAGDKQDLSIENTWDRYFDVVPASTPALLDQAHVLRYEVYCKEHRFEDPANHPNGRETDRHDPFSLHVALLYRPTGEMVGTVRLILPVEGMQPCLPLLASLGSEAQAELLSYPMERMAEISRYAVTKGFRRRKGEEEFPDVGFSRDSEDGKRLMPYLTLGLMRGIVQLGVSQQVDYLCACMRPALLRLLRQLGLEFKPIGPAVDHHGMRQPCIASLDELLLGLRTHRPELSRLVYR